ncbi:MAG: hypothetical protein ACKV2T_37040 [Kofleriaceae bacterium]
MAATTCETAEDCHNACAQVSYCDVATQTCEYAQPVEDGFPCAAASECYAGECIQIQCGDGIEQTGEACDDGNDVDGDGCDSDCEYSCTTDAECSPANACGTARCGAAHACVAGPPVNCSDADQCTADSCAPSSGCVHSVIDADHDGFGPGAACGGDCSDQSADARPGQSGWFNVKIPGQPAATDYDYNCDGVETKRYTFTSTCGANLSAFHCNLGPGSGWATTVVPACGATADYAMDCAWLNQKCQSLTMPVIQECR